jgi:hypothetical protein
LPAVVGYRFLALDVEPELERDELDDDPPQERVEDETEAWEE